MSDSGEQIKHLIGSSGQQDDNDEDARNAEIASDVREVAVDSQAICSSSKTSTKLIPDKIEASDDGPAINSDDQKQSNKDENGNDNKVDVIEKKTEEQPVATSSCASVGNNEIENDTEDQSNNNNSESVTSVIDQQHLDVECERLLRNLKRQVKQMMEEAVTKKFVHEDSSSIISLCVSIEACLSHGLKRRALGLFKTNSSTALVQKIAKTCSSAQEILNMVSEEEKRQQEELKQLQSQLKAADEQASNSLMSALSHPLGHQQQQQLHQSKSKVQAVGQKQKVPQVASNLSVHKRNRWIKCALIEKKLITIVEHLAENASKYYEPDALMANCLGAQLLCSLLIGACALEFSRSKLSDCYQFEEPSADELLKRHKLSNPIACLCPSASTSLATFLTAVPSSPLPSPLMTSSSRSLYSGGGSSTPASTSNKNNNNSGGGNNLSSRGRDPIHAALARSVTDHDHARCSRGGGVSSPRRRNRRATTSQASLSAYIWEEERGNSLTRLQAAADGGKRAGQTSKTMTTPVAGTSDDSTVGDGFKRTSVPRSTSPSPSGSGTSNLGRKDSRRRPLSLKTNFKTGALVTECHHYCCQDISEHQKTRGYSFTSRTNSSSLASGSQGAAATSFTCDTSAFGVGAPSAGSAPESQQQNLKAKAGGGGGGGICQRQQPHQDNYCWPIWSPRMLHETLHQNSKSSLLYAKNNVLLETQSHGTIAGYLSLHQTSSDDLILKWIPNQLINGGERHQNGARREAKVEQTEFGTAADLSSDVSNSAEAVDQADNCSGPKQHLVSNTTRDNKSNCDNNSHDGADQNGGDNYVTTSRSTHSQAPVGGSFLDLVVSLSVSRIVLLHCHFNGQTLIGTSRGQQQVSSQDSWQPVAAQQVAATNNCASHSTNNVVEDHDGEGEREEGLQAGGAELELSAASSDATPKASILQQQAEAETEPALVESSTEETLILVEADGIQRAPFKFPKGGLRWLLSCLDSGLRPDKYLEPAIKLDTSNTDETGSYLPDPLQMTHDEAVAKTNSHPCGENIAGESWATTTTSSGSLGSNSPSAASEPMSGSGSSRLDILLRRLPSLRRPGNKSKSADGLPPAPNSSQANSRNASPTPALIEEQQQQQHEQHLPQERAPLASQANSTRPMPFNYVYRIVSINQSEWGQGPGGRTPPHSADYRAGAKLGRNKKLSQHQRQQANSSGSQMFRWSLSKLTRFSSRTGSTSTASSSIGGGGASGTGGSSAPFGSNSTAPPASETGGSLMSLFYHQISSASCSQQATIGSTGSFGCDSLDQQQHRHLSDTMNSLEDNAGGANSSIGSLRRGSSSELIRIESKLSNLKKASSEELLALRDLSIMTLCETMRKQILARAFYGWLVYCRRMKIIRNHLVKLINLDCLNLIDEHDEPDAMEEARLGLTRQRWNDIISMVEARKPTTDNTSDKLRDSKSNVRAGDLDDSQFELNLVRYVNQLVYYGGIEDNSLRKEVWPYLLGHYKLSDSPAKIVATDESCRAVYESLGRDWSKIERVVKRRDNEILAANMAKVARRQQRQSGADASIPSGCVMSDKSLNEDSEIDEGEDDDVYDEVEERHEEVEEEKENDCKQPISIVQVGRSVDDTNNCSNRQEVVDGADKEQLASVRGDDGTAVKVNEQQLGERTVTSTTERKHGEEDCKAKVSANAPGTREGSIVNRVRKTSVSKQQGASRQKKKRRRRRFRLESTGSVGSDASITDQFGNNVHRIDKDVQRCDRNFWYFKDADNLNKLRNIMCSYVWQHLDVGYVQGMCDLAAPFLVIFDEEIKAYYCFEQLMKRMVANFPHGSQMDQHFESLKYLMQVLDPKLFEVLQSNGDYTHFYFCYRWLLLDFKRELVYEDVYRVWETIWSARHVATDHFVIFLALAMVRYYRDIIIENNMDFTDTIKFFNEMAERHDIKRIIALAQDSIVELECLIRDLS